MPVILSHSSALERLRSVPPRFDTSKPLDRSSSVPSDRPDCRRLARLDFKALGVSQEPIHLLVPGQTRGNRSKRFCFHALDSCTFPFAALRTLGADIYTAGPELCFIQMTRKTSHVGAIVLGYELCGSYSHFAPLVSGFYERPPLTSKKRIGQLLGQLKGYRGMDKGRSALPYILDGSASPMETVLACMLTLPNDLGGEGFIMPELNLVVALSEAEKQMTGTDTCRIDLAWTEKHIGLEYYGGPYHTDEVADRKRREALAHAGWTIYVVDIDRIGTYAEYAKLLALLKDAVPRRSHCKPAKAGDSKALLKRLLKATRCNRGMEAALFAPCVPPGSMKLHVR